MSVFDLLPATVDPAWAAAGMICGVLAAMTIHKRLAKMSFSAHTLIVWGVVVPLVIYAMAQLSCLK